MSRRQQLLQSPRARQNHPAEPGLHTIFVLGMTSLSVASSQYLKGKGYAF
jgi:hypothetical protein